MKTMETAVYKVYRIEHQESGDGPYRHFPQEYEVLDVLELHLSNIRRWPGPKDDGLAGQVDYDELYGFKSIAQLEEWFDEGTLEVLYEHGFVLREYETDHIEYGRKQVLFNRRTAKCLT
ncbi:hypothetical protein LCGC14_2127440 [marine sediment metagenome]|uniref:Uncharacterized protein n=1 Tax=marine sediment metagenome TaxID=412755 RepID=A0A0F9GYK5_9ZZZZ